MKLCADVNKCGVLFWESNAGEVNARTLEVEMCENLCSCAQQFVVFTLEDGEKILSKVENGVALIPQFDKSQYVTIGLYGSNIENGECVLRYSPQPVKVFVNAGSYTAGDGTATVFENATLEDLLAEIEKANEPITTDRIKNGAVTYDKVGMNFYSDGLNVVSTDDIILTGVQMPPNKKITLTAKLANKLTEFTEVETDKEIYSAKTVNTMFFNVGELFETINKEYNEKFATKDYVNEVIGGIENGSY